MAGQSLLKALIGAFVNRSRRAQHGTRIEVLWREMTAAGDLLIDALRLEQEFSKSDFTEVEGDVLKRLRLHRNTVECIAEDYASAVSKWREALQGECLPQDTRLSN